MISITLSGREAGKVSDGKKWKARYRKTYDWGTIGTQEAVSHNTGNISG